MMKETTESKRKAFIKKIDNCGETMASVLRWSGLWPLGEINFFQRNMWYVVMFAFSFNIWGLTGFVVFHHDNLSLMLSGIGIIVSLVCVFIKVLI